MSPYIIPGRRKEIDLGDFSKTAGELAYKFSQDIVNYIQTHQWNSTTIAEILGAISWIDKEFYRVLVGHYEDLKRGYNGDVWKK